MPNIPIRVFIILSSRSIIYYYVGIVGRRVREDTKSLAVFPVNRSTFESAARSFLPHGRGKEKGAITRKSYSNDISMVIAAPRAIQRKAKRLGTVFVYLICPATDYRFCVGSYFSASQSIERGNQGTMSLERARTMLELHRWQRGWRGG